MAAMATGGDALAGVRAAVKLDSCTGGMLRAYDIERWEEEELTDG